MSLEAIKQISETEQSAQRRINDAQSRARDIISNAQRTAAQAYNLTLEQAAAQAAEALAHVKRSNDDMTAQQLADYSRRREALQTQARHRMDQAVSIVIERVVG